MALYNARTELIYFYFSLSTIHWLFFCYPLRNS